MDNTEFAKNSDTEAETNIPTSEQVQNALMGYQVAVDLWINQGNQGWSKFNAMLVVNSIIIASIGFVGAGAGQQSSLILALPISGILICAVWYIHVSRDAAYSDYFVMSARELEEKYLSNSVQTISRGGKFAEGENVHIEIGNNSVDMKMSFLARLLRARGAANWIIVILIFLYAAIILQQVF